MERLYNKKLKSNARQLRRSMTKEERHLWYDFLKPLPVMVHRQKVFGNYIVDFYIAEAKLVIELDGSQHFEDQGQSYDAQRDMFLKAQGLTVLRIPNNEVNCNFRGVCEEILQRLKPSPSGRRWQSEGLTDVGEHRGASGACCDPDGSPHISQKSEIFDSFSQREKP